MKEIQFIGNILTLYIFLLFLDIVILVIFLSYYALRIEASIMCFNGITLDLKERTKHFLNKHTLFQRLKMVLRNFIKINNKTRMNLSETLKSVERTN